MHKKSSETERGSKISRLQFLRLLGAGAIGYFAYRAGFFNNLFGNATATTAVTAGTNATSQRYAATGSLLSSSAVALGRLDEDGILMMATPKPGGYSYRFDPTLFPSKDIRLDVSDTGGLELKQENGLKFIKFVSHNPGIGDGSNTVRIHVFTEDRTDEDKQKYNWINGAQEMGWLTRPNDLKNGEWTFICRPNGILNNTNAISAKLGGGQHTAGSPGNDEASCWNVNWYYDPSRINTLTFEFTHPDYEHGHTVKLYNTYKPLGDRWFGCKVVSMVRPDQSARDIITYFNEDPIDLNTGKPKNDGWKKYFEFTHTGQGPKYNIPHTWGGAKNTWRNDQLTSIDVAYMNHREIIALNNGNTI
ncbi:MAG: hypothetical protein ACJ72J_03185 [Nitrososphaeraceae archaeon]